MGLRGRGRNAGMKPSKPKGARQKQARGRMKKLFQELPAEMQGQMKTAAAAVKAGNHQQAANDFTQIANSLSSHGKHAAACRVQVMAAKQTHKATGDVAQGLAAAKVAVQYGSQASNKRPIVKGFAKLCNTLLKGGHKKEALELKNAAESGLGVSFPARGQA